MKRKTKKTLKIVSISIASLLFLGFLFLFLVGYLGYTQDLQMGNWSEWSIDNMKENFQGIINWFKGEDTVKEIIIYKTVETLETQEGSLVTPLTCSQIASKNNALYNEGITSTTNCYNQAKIECQQIGKTLEGYGFESGCCYYTCIVPQPTCKDSDGGQDDQQFIKGNVTDGTNYVYVDQCDWNIGGVTEYYCDGSTPKFTNYQCDNYWTCIDGACKQQLCEDIMNPTPEKCASGYTTDGGICQYWNIGGNEYCLSSFN